MLAVVGGHSFQDYAAYREAALAALPGLGPARSGEDVVLLGTRRPTAELARLVPHAPTRSASRRSKEGCGLVVLEAMAAGLPVVASDLPVFREYLVDGRDALLPAVGDPVALAEAMRAVVTDAGLRDAAAGGGRGGAAAVHLGGQRRAPPGGLLRGAAARPVDDELMMVEKGV